MTGGQKQEDKERVLWVKFEEADINGKRKVKIHNNDKYVKTKEYGLTSLFSINY